MPGMQLPCCENESEFVIDYDVGAATTTYLVCSECLEKPCFASDIKNKKEIQPATKLSEFQTNPRQRVRSV
ncbi:MAG: hypothetical protein GKS07_07400 [Nitrosopumilus sp.]|nr:MAG: hypothetical protein GKS07_07400 [Nitrosopumilus sp.]